VSTLPTPLLLDGGLATALEAEGFDLDDPLWSARLLIEAPEAIRRVHTAFLEAGADVIASASYQASLPGFAARGIAAEEGARLLTLSTQLAVDARDAFWAQESNRVGRTRPLVAASVGPYGAYLANGAEYTGDYGVDRTALEDFHRERWALFAEGDAELIACETIPSALEAEVLARLLNATPKAQAWISFSCMDATRISDGTPIREVARRLEGLPNLVAIGVNCTSPRYIPSLIAEVRAVSSLHLFVYPNSGEEYDASRRRWSQPPEGAPSELAQRAREWIHAGADGVGGCCRVSPEDIAEIRRIL